MFRDLKNKLDGPFYTIFTPFDDQYEVDYDVLERYLSRMYEQGARKFYAMAYNSRYSQLSHTEIMELNAFCAKTVKGFKDDTIVIVGDPIHCSTKESIEFAIHAKECGADLISLIMREKYFTDEQVLSHYNQIGIESNFPLLVHEMPFLSGSDGTQMHWPQSLISSLPKVSHIVALKEDAKDFEVARQAFELEPNIKVILAGGGKARYREFYKMGARCWLNGISIFDASIAELFWEAMNNDDEDTQNFIIEELEKPFFGGVVKKYGWHRTNKALLEAAGLMSRRDRMPLPHLSDKEFVDVCTVYSEIQNTWQSFLEKKA